MTSAGVRPSSMCRRTAVEPRIERSSEASMLTPRFATAARRRSTPMSVRICTITSSVFNRVSFGGGMSMIRRSMPGGRN